MANTKPESVPVADDANKSPALYFQSFSWTPRNLPTTVPVSSHLLCKLVNAARDIGNGAALVFELTYEMESSSDDNPYLGSFHIDVLQRMANTGLNLLNDITEEMLKELHSLDKGAI